MTNHIVSHRHFDASRIFYQSWPDAFILSAIGVEIGGLNLESVLTIFLLFIQLLGAYIMVVNRQIGQDLPHYIAISHQERAWCEFLLGDVTFIRQTEEALDNATNCTFVYNNPDFKLYICENR